MTQLLENIRISLSETPILLWALGIVLWSLLFLFPLDPADITTAEEIEKKKREANQLNGG